MSNNKLVKGEKPVDKLKLVLNADSVKEQFRNALGENSNTFVASVIDLYNTDNSLHECNVGQVVQECLKAATLKLPINKALGQAYILPFRNKGVMTPTFIIGYKGLIQLAMRAGQYKYINADLVYEGEITGKDKLTGAIDFNGEKKSDKVVGYFAHIELLNGFRKTLYSTVEEVAKHAKKYAPTLKNNQKITFKTLMALAGKDPTGIGWTGDFDSMAIKTVLRNLISKYGYMSIEMQNAVAYDMKGDSMEERDEAIMDAEATVINMNDHFGEENAKAEEQPQIEQPPY